MKSWSNLNIIDGGLTYWRGRYPYHPLLSQRTVKLITQACVSPQISPPRLVNRNSLNPGTLLQLDLKRLEFRLIETELEVKQTWIRVEGEKIQTVILGRDKETIESFC